MRTRRHDHPAEGSTDATLNAGAPSVEGPSCECPTGKGTVLVVDDSRTICAVLGQSLRDRSFKTLIAHTGKGGLKTAHDSQPDAIVLDLNLPDVDGYEVCRILKADPATYKIPVMVLTALEQPGFEVMAIDAGADDFVTKPVDPLVLDARLRMLIQRNRRERFSNPLTGLPGNILIDQELSMRLDRGDAFCLAYADLDYFKNYNDRYGYRRGDDVLLLTAGTIQDAVSTLGAPGDFVGHIGGDDFVIMAGCDRMKPIADRIIADFKAAVPEYYDEKTRARGSFDAADRRGNAFTVPIMSISIAAVSNDNREFGGSLEMVDVVTELKRFAKAQEGSVFVVDRRRDSR